MLDPSNSIHSSAIISENVIIGKNNVIAANVSINGNIIIGDNNRIGFGTIITNTVRIGNNNLMTAYCSIGFPGEMGVKGDILTENGEVSIGDNNTIREFVTIHSPVRRSSTTIGNKCYIMSKAYIAHDVQISDNVTIASGSTLGGGVVVENNAYLGFNCSVHQRSVIGESAMIGMQSAVNSDIPPYSTVAGVPARIIKFNKAGASRKGLSMENIELAQNKFREMILGQESFGNPVALAIESFRQKHQKMLKKFIITI